MSRTQANLLLLFVALIWGSAFVAQAHANQVIEPFTYTGIRFLLGFCVVAPLAWRDYRALERRGDRFLQRDVLGITVLGLLLALGAVFQQIGINGTTVTNAGFLTALYVPLVPLIAIVSVPAAQASEARPQTRNCPPAIRKGALSRSVTRPTINTCSAQKTLLAMTHRSP